MANQTLIIFGCICDILGKGIGDNLMILNFLLFSFSRSTLEGSMKEFFLQLKYLLKNRHKSGDMSLGLMNKYGMHPGFSEGVRYSVFKC